MGFFTLAYCFMNQPQQRSSWRRWIALFGLLSLLFLCVVSASHIHGTAVGGTVRPECKLCVTGGVSLTLTTEVQLCAALVLTLLLFPTTTAQPCRARCHHPGNPRSPPLLS